MLTYFCTPNLLSGFISSLSQLAWEKRLCCCVIFAPIANDGSKSIKSEAELMAELLSRDYDNSVVTIGNKIRRLALNQMLYKGSEYAAVSGAMMGVTKEATIILDSARQNLFGGKHAILSSSADA